MIFMFALLLFMHALESNTSLHQLIMIELFHYKCNTVKYTFCLGMGSYFIECNVMLPMNVCSFHNVKTGC